MKRLRAGRIRAALTTPAVLVPVLLAGCWPVGRWYFLRMTDGSDEPLGVLALVAAVAFLPRAGWHTGRPAAGLGAAAAILAFYALTYERCPPLVRAALVVTALATLIPATPRTSRVPLWSLLVLSLPVIASLQFYLGFPLRAVTAWCTAQLLSLAGIATTARGTVLTWSGGDVLIDAPCSGIRMLWMAAFLSAVLAAWHRLPAMGCVRLARHACLLVFAANLARSNVLFLIETGHWPKPPFAHDGAGLVAFALVALGVTIRSTSEAQRSCRGDEAVIFAPLPAPPSYVGGHEFPIHCHPLIDNVIGRRAQRVCHVLSDKPVLVARLVLALAGVAAGRGVAGEWRHGSFSARGESMRAMAAAVVEWPTHFEGRVLREVALRPEEARLARGFPGAIAVFTDGVRRVVFRQVWLATRQVHPIADCLRAAGYAVTPQSALRDRDGQAWATLRAERNGLRWIVRERLHDARGRAWTDVSAWYWSALWDASGAPWWSTVVIAPEFEDAERYTSSIATGQ